MRKYISSVQGILTFGLIAIMASSCSTASKTTRYLERAKRYVESGQYDSAEVEYLNVLKLEPANAEAICRLAAIYYDQGQTGRMFPFLYKGREVQPENVELRLKLGMSLLTVRKFDEARAEANFVLARKPQLEDAPLLLADSAFKPKEIDEARQLLQSLPPLIADSAPVMVALGMLDFRQGKINEAEVAFKKAQAADPKSRSANSAMGFLFWNRKDLPNAARCFAAAAEFAPARSLARMQYIKFKLTTGDTVVAKNMLNEITKKTPDYLPAWMTLAEIAVVEKRYDDAVAAVGKVLARDGIHPEALLFNGRIRMEKGEIDSAITEFEKTTKVYPLAYMAHFQLGMAYLAKDDLGNAAPSLKQAIALAPGFTDAIVALAGINVRNGEFAIAVEPLRQVLQGRSGTTQAGLLLANAYRSLGQLDQALVVYRELCKVAPAPDTFLLMGLVLLEQKKPEEARQSFNQALALDPNYLPAAEQIVNLDFLEKKMPAAIQRTEALVAKNPKLAGLHLLLAKIHLSQGDNSKAESALLRTIELEPNTPAAYFLLARVYKDARQFEKALARLQEVTGRNPKDEGAWSLIGELYNEQKNYKAAREAYEKVLLIEPKSTSALNNLSLIYLENFGETDKAYELAQKARTLLPRDPSTADTLGWAFYAKKQYSLALPLLQESVDKLPLSADVNYHLGMTHYMLGEENAARTALGRALELNGAFAGSADAKLRLAVLEIDGQKAGPDARATLEKIVSERGNEPPVLARLASIYERTGATDKAIEAYEAMLKAGPDNLNAILPLIRLRTSRQETAKALEMAKAARKLVPDDLGVAHSLGRLAYLTGDYTWASSLLQETVRKQPNDPELLSDFAEASYSIGRVSDAVDAMRQSLKSGAAKPVAEKARLFLEMVSIASNPAQRADAPARVAEVLNSEPSDVPALVAMAALANQRGDLGSARQIYEKVIGLFPNFTPAKKYLAIIYSENPANDVKTFEFASKAREVFPDDSEIAKVLGIVAYRKNNFTTAKNLLRESGAKLTSDTQLMYYLGMTEYRLKDLPSAKKSLQRALELKLEGNFADEARRVLAEIK